MTMHDKQFSSVLRRLLPATALGMFVFCSGASTFAQEAEIEIINPDGEPVDGSELLTKPQANLVSPARQKQAGDTGKLKLGSVDGKITVKDDDGNEQQIDLDSAQSIVVQQSTQSVNINGKQETKVVKKAIVIGVDGQRYEIDLSEDGDEGLALPAMPEGFPDMFGAQRFSAKQTGNKYMIGVHCTKVPAALQAQLGLEDGTGLVVDTVGPDSPAAAAGFQEHDILLFADDQELRVQEDLVSAVQKAGEGKFALSLSVLRGGSEVGIEVSPVERTAEQRRGGFRRGGIDLNFDPFGAGFGDLEFKQFGPGLIMGGDLDDMLDGMRQRAQKQMQEMQQQMRQPVEAGE